MGVMYGNALAANRCRAKHRRARPNYAILECPCDRHSMDDKQIFLSSDIAHRLAAIDIGSNSVRLIVAEPLRGGNYRILDEEREPTRLGRKLNSTGSLDPQAVELTLAALRRFKQISGGYQVDELRTIATCDVR